MGFKSCFTVHTDPETIAAAHALGSEFTLHPSTRIEHYVDEAIMNGLFDGRKFWTVEAAAAKLAQVIEAAPGYGTRGAETGGARQALHIIRDLLKEGIFQRAA